MPRTEKLAQLVLRAGVAFAFLYPPISALMQPAAWIGYFPSFMYGYVPDAVLLHGFGLIEVVIALWILSGRRIFWPAAAATAMLAAIVVMHPDEFIVLFRDVSIAAASLFLALEALPEELRA